MGNTIQCCHAGSAKTLRIHRDKGRMLEFCYPVPASKLMGEYPNHLLVYRSVKGVPDPAAKQSFKKSALLSPHVNVRVVRLGDMLRLGQDYFLVNIPEQYTVRFAKYFKVRSPKGSPRDRLPEVDAETSNSIVMSPMAKSILQSDTTRKLPQRSSKKAQSPSRRTKVGGKPRTRRGTTRSPLHKVSKSQPKIVRYDHSNSTVPTKIHKVVNTANTVVDTKSPSRGSNSWEIVPFRGPGGKPFLPRTPRSCRRLLLRGVWKPVLDSISEVVE